MYQGLVMKLELPWDVQKQKVITAKSIICCTLLGVRAFVFVGLEIGTSVEVEIGASLEVWQFLTSLTQ